MHCTLIEGGPNAGPVGCGANVPILDFGWAKANCIYPQSVGTLCTMQREGEMNLVLVLHVLRSILAVLRLDLFKVGGQDQGMRSLISAIPTYITWLEKPCCLLVGICFLQVS